MKLFGKKLDSGERLAKLTEETIDLIAKHRWSSTETPDVVINRALKRGTSPEVSHASRRLRAELKDGGPYGINYAADLRLVLDAADPYGLVEEE